MKIVVVSIFRRNYGGGEGQIAHEMADVFSQKHDVTLICPGDRTGLEVRESGLKVFTVQSASREHVSSPLLSQVTLRSLYAYLGAFKPDVIHAHDPALLGVVLQVWAKTHQIPFVYTTHVLPSRATEFGTLDALRFNFDFIAHPLIHRFLLNFYQNCDAVIALNRIASEEVRAFGYKGPMHIIPNGRVLAHYASRKVADPALETKTLTAIGFLSQRKNQAFLIKVMQYLPDNFRLKMAGTALSPDYEKSLRDQVAEMDLHTVEFLGKVPHEKIAQLLERSHLLVSASTMEVQSLVVIEALASGTPVVGLANETVDELIDEHVGARLPADASPEAFAATIAKICALPPDNYAAISRSARTRVQHLDWLKVMDRTAAIYTALRENPHTAQVQPSSRRRIADRILSIVPDHEWKKTLLDLSSSIPLPSLPAHAISLETRMISGITNTGAMLLYAAIKADHVVRSIPGRLSSTR
ncbi:MAG: glycosyltransferase [Anaerolineales bacterium]|nr:glycosyltransferase [Anaerolineales bacterium]